MITRKSRAEIERMRGAGRIVAEVLALMEEHIRPGISTAELDRIAERHIRAAGATPSFLGYLGAREYDPRDPHAYPASTCISIDDEIVHGIPGDRELRAGQLVSVDVGAILNGWHGDGARTFVCGGIEHVAPEVQGLVETTRLALMAGIAAAVPGNRIGDISAAIEDVARPRGYGIVRQYVGHGIGTAMHEDPQVPNFRSRAQGIGLAPGICLAIEPMFTLGSEATRTLTDGWTVSTRDGSLSAHFEHSIAVTESGPEILTRVG